MILENDKIIEQNRKYNNSEARKFIKNDSIKYDWNLNNTLNGQ